MERININLNEFLKNETDIKKDADDKDSEDEYPITVEFQNSTFRVLIKLKENYQL